MQDKATLITIDLGAIERNVKKIVETYGEYRWRVAVVKSDCYGHKGNEVVRRILRGGANYIAVSFLNEALRIRVDFPDVPIMLLVPPPIDLVDRCIENDVEITVPGSCVFKADRGQTRRDPSAPGRRMRPLQRSARQRELPRVYGRYRPRQRHFARRVSAQLFCRRPRDFRRGVCGV